MKLVDVLLSSHFVKDLEQMKNGEETGSDKEGEVPDDVVRQGKDVMMLLEWMTRSVSFSLQTNSHRLIYPKGINNK